jgi:light-harvesting complex I chlorophyll a/b binding protein 1
MAASTMNLQVQQAFTAGKIARRQPFKQAARAPIRIVRAEDPISPDEGPVSGEMIGYAKELPGVTDPFPNIFDPADFLGNARQKADVKRWRESELTHGRVAMLASLGFVVQEQIIDFPNAPFPHVEGTAITHFQQVEAKGAIFWEPLVFAIGLAEAYRVSIGWAPPTSEGFNKLKEDYEPGNLGFDPLNLYPSDPAAQRTIKDKELNNGRLAMIAIAAFVAQELVEKRPIFDRLLITLGQDIKGGPNT